MYLIARKPCGRIAEIVDQDELLEEEVSDFIDRNTQQGYVVQECRGLLWSAPTGSKRDRWQCRRHELAECACLGVSP